MTLSVRYASSHHVMGRSVTIWRMTLPCWLGCTVACTICHEPVWSINSGASLLTGLLSKLSLYGSSSGDLSGACPCEPFCWPVVVDNVATTLTGSSSVNCPLTTVTSLRCSNHEQSDSLAAIDD